LKFAPSSLVDHIKKNSREKKEHAKRPERKPEKGKTYKERPKNKISGEEKPEIGKKKKITLSGKKEEEMGLDPLSLATWVISGQISCTSNKTTLFSLFLHHQTMHHRQPLDFQFLHDGLSNTTRSNENNIRQGSDAKKGGESRRQT